MNSEAVKAELQRLAEDHGGVIHPADVIEAARDVQSAMHSWFEWDNDEAAHQYRLEQARRLLRVYVVELPTSGSDVPVRAFVSLTSDRKTGGGYRPMAMVLSDKAQHAQLLADALAELRQTQRRFQKLKELAPVFAVVDEIEEQQRLAFPAAWSA